MHRNPPRAVRRTLLYYLDAASAVGVKLELFGLLLFGQRGLAGLARPIEEGAPVFVAADNDGRSGDALRDRGRAPDGVGIQSRY